MDTPKVFISYSWSSSGHCDCIRSYAERLVNDGVGNFGNSGGILGTNCAAPGFKI